MDVALPHKELLDLLFQLTVTLGIGLLIGLEREFSHRSQRLSLAGARTFGLISILGFLSALLGQTLTPWIPAVAMLAVIAIAVTGYLSIAKEGRKGITTEISLFVALLLGMLVYLKYLVFAVSVAILVSIILSLKPTVKNVVGRITEEELHAIFKFLIVSVLVLPLLPNEVLAFGVLNPREIWAVVVLVLSISFLGYLLIKFWNTQGGIAITGFLGGLVSSTAVAWLFSKKSKTDPSNAKAYALATLLAVSLMYARLMVISALMSTRLAMALLPAFAFLFAAGLVMVMSARSVARAQRPPETPQEDLSVLGNPFNLGDALKFALLYSFVTVLVKYANQHFGSAGVYFVSAASGFASVDAIALSIARAISTSEPMPLQTGVQAIILATLSNNVFKLFICLVQGHRAFYRMAAVGIALMIIATCCWVAAFGG